MSVVKYFRGWIVITIIQVFGLIFENLRDPKSLHKTFLKNISIPNHAIFVISHIFLVKFIQDVLLKALLIIAFKNQALHGLHILTNLLYIVYFLIETFYFELFAFSIATMTQLIMSGLTIVFTLALWGKISEPEKLPEAEKKPRRLIAKHYMEAQVKNLDTEPKKLR